MAIRKSNSVTRHIETHRGIDTAGTMSRGYAKS